MEVPYLLLMAEVAKIPRLAERVVAIGLEISCVHSGAFFVFAQRQ